MFRSRAAAPKRRRDLCAHPRGARAGDEMKVRVLIRLKPGVLDAQGRAIGNALADLGYDAIQGVRVGKLVELEVAGSDPAKAQAIVKEACEKLLANPVIETFSIEV